MTIDKDTTATLYRDDPQYTDVYGTPGMKLNAHDAYIEIEAIPLDKIIEKTQFDIKCVERKKEGIPILPIQEQMGLDFKFLEAYGFLYPVIKVEALSPKEDRIFNIKLEFDPDLIGTHIIKNIPLTARYIGDNRIELEEPYNYEMKNPYCLRGKHTVGEKLIKLHRDSNNKQIFILDQEGIIQDTNERVQILTNWDPSVSGFR